MKLLIDLFKDGAMKIDVQPAVDEEHPDYDTLVHVLMSAFDGLQDRQKNIMSDLITVRLADVLMDIQVPTSEYTFINQDILRQILSGKVVNQQAIAEKYGRKEASVSRALNDFIRKLQEL